MNMREKIISILSELRPEFDFNESLNFIEEGMLLTIWKVLKRDGVSKEGMATTEPFNGYN